MGGLWQGTGWCVCVGVWITRDRLVEHVSCAAEPVGLSGFIFGGVLCYCCLYYHACCAQSAVAVLGQKWPFTGSALAKIS